MFDRPAVKGEVQTVLGPVSPDRLGVTMVHEHLLLDLTCLFVEPESADERALARRPLTLDHLAWVRRNWNSSLDNLRLDDEALAIEEARQLKLEGGGTLVEVSNVGLARSPLAWRASHAPLGSMSSWGRATTSTSRTRRTWTHAARPISKRRWSAM